MRENMQNIMNNLNVLCSLSQNDKLITNGEVFSIHMPTTLRSISRMWTGESRGGNISRVRMCIQSAFSFCKECLQEYRTMENELHSNNDEVLMRTQNLQLQCVNMLEALDKSRKGLENMQQTYRDDACSASQIKQLVNEIQIFLDIMLPRIKPISSGVTNSYLLLN